jgi:pimeloyl-ACP methyl ester carboxylesterase
MPHVEGAGVALHYEERGEGAPLLVIHGMASSASQWTSALDELAAAGARAVSYDRRGYGSSGAPEPYAATTVQEQAEDAAAVMDALGLVPALLVGDGFGALVALELLVRRPELARGAVLAEPPLYAYVPTATEALAAERQALEQALREGGPARAVQAWLAARGGAAASPPDALPPTAGDERSHSGFFADYAGIASWSPSRRELRSIALPVSVVTRPDAAPHVLAAAAAGAALLPDVRRSDDGDVVAAARGLLR